nr:hypothetical protein [Tanacetum cinerariifolium]
MQVKMIILYAWLSEVEYLNVERGMAAGCLGDMKNFFKNGKLEKVVAVIKSCTPNALGELTVTLKDPSGTLSGTVHHKVLTKGGYEKSITVEVVLILNNVLVFSPKPSAHYINITFRNMVNVFHKNTIFSL